MSAPRRVLAKRPSLHDVARLAGVSATAVSYVMNGRTGEVGAETRTRITSAIKTLKYRPQRRGLSLRMSQEFAIGLLVIDTNPSFLADPFTTQVATGLSNALTEPGFGLTVTGVRSVDDLNALLRRPIGVDGYCVMASGPAAARTEVYRRLADTNLPVLVVQEEAPAAIDDACGVLQDDFSGASELARYLTDRGARRIVWLAPQRGWPAIERRVAAIRSGLPKGATLGEAACDELDFQGTVAAVDRILGSGPPPDAIMGANDQIAIAALHALRRRKLRVPRDIQVTGYNNFAFRNFATPLLTTVTSCATDIGYRAAQAMLARLDSGAFRERRIELPVELTIGETTNTRPVR